MIVNGKQLLDAAPIVDMIGEKEIFAGLSYGLSEVGYDIRLKQPITFKPPHAQNFYRAACLDVPEPDKKMLMDLAFNGYVIVNGGEPKIGRNALASTVEWFKIPCDLSVEVRNKSTNARFFIDAANSTDLEPGWGGCLTLEVTFRGCEAMTLPAGYPIAKLVFMKLAEPAQYNGKYQNQSGDPTPARFE